MNGGFILLPRSLIDRDRFGTHPLCPVSSFAWLVANAEWRATERVIGGKAYKLERGQLTASTRFLSRAWGVAETTVRRRIKCYESGALIGAETGAGQYVITVRDYWQYQGAPSKSGAEDGAASVTPMAQHPAQTELRNKDIPYGEAAPPAFRTINQVIWTECLGWLRSESGRSESECRSLLGRWRKTRGEGALLAVLADAQRDSRSDPVAWIEAALRQRTHSGQKAPMPQPRREGVMVP